MDSRQAIGAGLLAAVVIVSGSLAIFGGGQDKPKEAPRPRPQILQKDPTKPATQNAAPEWRTFVCQRGGQPLNYFKQAKAEFVERVNGRVKWRVTTPEGSQVLTVDPSSVVCGYMNQ